MNTTKIGEWKWYGFPMHHCCGNRCQFHLATSIDGLILVSTVGRFVPDPLRHPDMSEPVGRGRDFETMVFLLDGEDDSGIPKVASWEEVESEGYDDGKEAERGHSAMCEKWSGKILKLHGKSLMPAPIDRDQEGYWVHPGIPWAMVPEDTGGVDDFFSRCGYETSYVVMEEDAPSELVDKYFERHSPDCSYWKPSPPEGEGWFLVAIHETEDGPSSMWIRRGNKVGGDA